MASMISIRPRPMLRSTPFASTSSAVWRNKSQPHIVNLSPSPSHPQFSVRQAFHNKIFACGHSPVPSRKNDDHKKIKGYLVGASFALACALGAVFVGGLSMNRIAIAGPREVYQKAPHVEAVSLGGKKAMESLLDMTIALSSSKMEPPSPRFLLPSRPSMEEVKEIKMQAIRLMRYGKPEDALNLLLEAYNDCCDDPEPAYHVEMALVEVLICQGKYKKALQRSCLNDSQRLPSDARFPLYKAIIYTMLDDKEEAKRWWEQYTEEVEG